MPFEYTIDLPRSIVLSRGWGALTDGELVAHARALAVDPRFKPHFRQICSFLEVSDVQVTAAGIREMTLLNPFGAGARRALVVKSDVAFGMARMYQIMRDDSPDEVEIFRDLDRALEWLRLADAKEALLPALRGQAS